MMECHICGFGPAQGVSVFRQNETGVAGVWACKKHAAPGSIPDDVDELVSILEKVEL
jgi:hypothetical protein